MKPNETVGNKEIRNKEMVKRWCFAVLLLCDEE